MVSFFELDIFPSKIYGKDQKKLINKFIEIFLLKAQKTLNFYKYNILGRIVYTAYRNS